jgi:hypothetical protein
VELALEATSEVKFTSPLICSVTWSVPPELGPLTGAGLALASLSVSVPVSCEVLVLVVDSIRLKAAGVKTPPAATPV